MRPITSRLFYKHVFPEIDPCETHSNDSLENTTEIYAQISDAEFYNKTSKVETIASILIVCDCGKKKILSTTRCGSKPNGGLQFAKCRSCQTECVSYYLLKCPECLKLRLC